MALTLFFAISVLLPIALILAGKRMHAADDPLSNFTDDELGAAALRVMTERPVCSHSWAGGTVERCDQALSQVKQLRTKYANYEPIRMRKAILRWLEYFEREANEAREDCVTRKSLHDQEEYHKRNESDAAKTNAIINTIKNGK